MADVLRPLSPSVLTIQDFFKRFEIKAAELSIYEDIGQGYFGKVYRGLVRGRQVAIKQIILSGFRNSDQAQLFLKELEITSKLNHPCCVELIGIVSLGADANLLLTEYVGGGSLKQFIRAFPERLTPVACVSIAQSVAEGLQYLHSFTPMPIIHRDLTSSNVLISRPEGDRIECKLCDFGLARLQPESGPMTTAMGSLASMAPEVFSGGLYCEKADIFSFAILLWEVLHRKQPFRSLPAQLVAAQAHTHQLRPDISGLPPPWAQLLSYCWLPDAHSRPPASQILRFLTLIPVDTQPWPPVESAPEGSSFSMRALEADSGYYQNPATPS